ncbi:hypothetical protein MFLO_15960 [Listeria floridensis FSL S10-1187]|uniref:IrrE N-terminal-like domain-containing protein n=1 Tax=Listeria floridensis FSL S10-1187 TaxID=1265817 RepID=A0ABP3AWH7_9LIST|nr:ImmA/IrrE family metallo-endopeptidase [Listeria floridensis]EUJ23460.1 hypothetical protein MFLO_15960 [Listeria floridensis FSL S10-1187]
MNYLDDLVENIYDKLEIKPGQIHMNTICAKLNLTLIKAPTRSRHTHMRNRDYIFIDDRKHEQEQLEEFSHELGHYFLHDGGSLRIKNVYYEYQERQANNFAERFLVPFFALRQIELPPNRADAVYFLETKFNIRRDLAKKTAFTLRENSI